jgi:acyl carrier protein
MAPSVIVPMDVLPVTHNGKIDRNALPDPESAATTDRGSVAPRNGTEERLAIIWKELLQVEQVGVYDDFFEKGGHSLLAMRAISAIQKEFSLEIPLRVLFESTTIADISAYLEVMQYMQLNSVRDGAGGQVMEL